MSHSVFRGQNMALVIPLHRIKDNVNHFSGDLFSKVPGLPREISTYFDWTLLGNL